MQHHKYSLSELNEMIPWEKSIYVSMLIKYIEEENEKTPSLFTSILLNKFPNSNISDSAH